MRLKKMIQLAAIFAPLALLSACGRGPAYGEASAAASANPITQYNTTTQNWDNVPVPIVDLPPGTPIPTDPPATDVPTGGSTTVTPPTTATLQMYCVIHNCTIVRQNFPPTTWGYHIPVSAPNSVPKVGTQVIYGNQVYRVMGVSTAQTKLPSLMIQPIAVLQRH
jgi:hypothetical protein